MHQGFEPCHSGAIAIDFFGTSLFGLLVHPTHFMQQQAGSETCLYVIFSRIYFWRPEECFLFDVRI